MRRILRTPSPALVVACIALAVALGPAAYAADTIFSTDIVDGEVKAADLSDNAVSSAKVVDESLTTADLKGADLNGSTIDLAAGAVPKGRCRTSVPTGMLFYGERAPADNRVLLKICNLTGERSPRIQQLPLRIVTFG
jgi:uncharacterized protein YjbI with pentapeptide repeats